MFPDASDTRSRWYSSLRGGPPAPKSVSQFEKIPVTQGGGTAGSKPSYAHGSNTERASSLECVVGGTTQELQKILYILKICSKYC